MERIFSERHGVRFRILALFLVTSLIMMFIYIPSAMAVSGTLPGDTTWSGTVNVTGDVTVPSGLTLTILPGTTVIISALSDDTGGGIEPTKVELIVQGTLTAVGTLTSRITFTDNAAVPAPQDWHGVRFLPGGTGTVSYSDLQWGAKTINIDNSSPTITYNDIRNSAGAVYAGNGALPVIRNNTFLSNGTAIEGNLASPTLEKNLVASSSKTGIKLVGSNSLVMSNELRGNATAINVTSGSPQITNNMIYGNDGTAVSIDSASNTTVLNNTINDNKTGVDVDATSTATIKNNIITNSKASGNGIRVAVGGIANISYNDVWNNTINYNGATPGVGDISANPLFTNAAAGDLHLLWGSPAIDAATSVGASTSDYDGDARPNYAGYDIGADEFYDTIPPTAEAGGPYFGNEGSSIAFDGSGSTDDIGITLYEWDWENDGIYDYSNTGPTASHVYANDGSYTVKLRVRDTGGNTGTDTAPVTVADLNPNANFSGIPTSGTEPLLVSFTDASTSYDGITSWQWDFNNDGTVDSTAQNPSYTYSLDGTYTISLTVREADGDPDNVTKIAYMNVADANPSANFSGTPTSGTYPLTVSFTDSSTSYDGITSWAWDFDNNGTVDSTLQNPSYTYVNPGTYTVSLTVTEADGDIDTEVKIGYTKSLAAQARTEDPSVTTTGSWIIKTDPSHSGTTQIISKTIGDSVSFIFEGTGISWLSSRYYNRGHGKVYIDGVYQQEVDLYSSGTWQSQKPVFTKTGLSSGTHTIKIEVAPKSSWASDNWVPVDAFDVFTDLTRVEEDSPSVTKVGTWTPKTDGSHSGTTQIISNTIGDSATYTFTGTSIQWVSSRYSNRGKAKVYIDDIYQQEIDLYSTGSWLAQQVVFTKTGLSSGTHTIKIEVSGKNPLSGGPWGSGWVPIDAFDTSNHLTRTEETSPNVTYNTGSWTSETNSSLSGTTQRLSKTIGDTATFNFTGDSIALISSRLINRGHAKIYVDGVFQQEIDPYSSGYLQPQEVVFTKTGLGGGTHTITVEVAPKSPWASDNYVAVDAFDVR